MTDPAESIHGELHATPAGDMVRSVWSTEGVGQRQRGSFSEQGRAESGEEAGRATSMGSRQLSMDERDGREDEPRNPEDGEDDD